MNEFTLDQVKDAVVYDVNGDKVGSVEQVYLDARTNDPSFVTVRTGFFGMKETFIPLANAELSEDRLTVPFEKDFIKDAPNIGADGPIDHSEELRIWDHYGIDYSEGDRSGEHVGDPTDDDGDADGSSRLRKHT
ncbi:PRC-barrel domain-containing protein [Flaviflexus huanghaiensis]|uniref:PRC-barrel domain-containing protein n=1 Tax=Flaviflexus huanghaiensis TaxID=1111473 RepID=UPI0015F8212B|nr:PRC-barrel domain-containing protein [Flaviflexus huanghaiensis]